MSTFMLTSAILLEEIPAVPDSNGNRWKVRALSIGGKNPALAKLVEWEKTEKQNFKKIIISLTMAAKEIRCQNPKWVKKCVNHDVYEAIAHRLEARLMFFYSEEKAAIICTNHCWKPSDNQDKAFADCAKLKDFFESHHG